MKQEINKDTNTNTNTNEQSRPTSSLDLLLCCLFYVLAGSYIPIAVYLPMPEWASAVLALGICIAGVFVLYRIARTFSAIAVYVILLGIFILFGGSLLPIGLLSAFITATCVFAHMVISKRSPIIWGLPIIPLIIAILLFRSPSAAVLSIATLPCALFLAYSVKNTLSRISAVCHISFGICISVILLFCATVWSAYGELTLSAVRAAIDLLKEQVILTLSAAVAELEGMLGTASATTDVKNLVEVTVASMFNLLPALIITLANVISYVIHSLFLSISYPSTDDIKAVQPMLQHDMSLTSAIVYLVSFVLSFILVSESTALYGSAAENMMLILAPGLILMTLSAIRAFSAKKGPSCLGTLLYFGVIFVLVSFSAIAIIAVSFAGAIVTILAYIAKRKSNQS